MTTPHAALSDQLAPLAAALADVLARKSDLEAVERDLKARIRTLVPGPDTYAAGEATLTISPNRRFDANTAMKVLPPNLLDLCLVSKVDSTAAKKVLPPALYDQCMTEVGELRVAFAR